MSKKMSIEESERERKRETERERGGGTNKRDIGRGR